MESRGERRPDAPAGRVIIPIRHLPGGPKGGDGPGGKGMRHRDSIIVGLGLIIFLSVTWIYFVHRMYLNVRTDDAAP
ncbi:hypothetical protein TSOC_012773 [Tetrabaena socialis]|uniref:Uncharacterized protein n=1 Tax=Tetrabaena socialis TaxID=47790 RepID=A0A2J7ZM51_9CHLO|nr:hypothetical protein TSOC_012773 [Tetrabaena socialis]|eukprot:PNH01349.1 hypothetical protein TSOC_012773 [Tetrabaena socialis]